MNSLRAVSRQMKAVAGVAALAATLFTSGGTLALADHYASTAGDAQIDTFGGSAARQTATSFSREMDNGRAPIVS